MTDLKKLAETIRTSLSNQELLEVADALDAYAGAQEPVAWLVTSQAGNTFYCERNPALEYSAIWLTECQRVTPLYAAPPPAKPASVSREKLREALNDYCMDASPNKIVWFARALGINVTETDK